MPVLLSGNEWQFVNAVSLHVNPFLLNSISSLKGTENPDHSEVRYSSY